MCHFAADAGSCLGLPDFWVIVLQLRLGQMALQVMVPAHSSSSDSGSSQMLFFSCDWQQLSLSGHSTSRRLEHTDEQAVFLQIHNTTITT